MRRSKRKHIDDDDTEAVVEPIEYAKNCSQSEGSKQALAVLTEAFGGTIPRKVTERITKAAREHTDIVMKRVRETPDVLAKMWNTYYNGHKARLMHETVLSLQSIHYVVPWS
jgi:hypothetical protein